MASVLSISSNKENENKIIKTQAIKRPRELQCHVHHCVRKGLRFVVIIGLYGEDPYEIFVNLNHDSEGEIIIPKTIKDGTIKKESRGKYFLVSESNEYRVSNCGSDENMEAVTRLVSTSLRHGADISFIVHQLEKTQGDMQTFSKVLARVLKKYINEGTKVFGISNEDCERNESSI